MSEHEWLTVKEYADLKRVAEETVRRWIRAGKVEIERKGERGHYRIAGLVENPSIRPTEPGRGGVYFITCGEFVKIGRADSVYRRFAAIQTYSPYEVRIEAFQPMSQAEAIQREKELHRRFAEFRHMREWFRFEPPIRQYIAEHGQPWQK